MKRISVLSLLIIALMCNIAFGFSFNVDKPGIHIATEPGQTVDGKITITNTGDKVMDFRANVADWKIESNGSKGFYPAGTLPLSCSNWLNVFPKSFSVEPGKSAEVNYVLTVPAKAQGGHYSVIFFETMKAGYKNTDVIFAGRIGTIIYHHIKGEQIVDGELLEGKVNWDSKNLKTKLAFENKGNVYLMVKPSVALLDKTGQIIFRKEMPKFGVMPGGYIKRSAEFPMEMTYGNYLSVVTTEFGSHYGVDEFKVVESQFEIKKDQEETDPKIIIKNFVIKKFTPIIRSDLMKFFVLVENKNKKFQTIDCQISVLDRKDNVIKTLELQKDYNFSPNSSKLFSKKFNEGLPKGKYKVIAQVKLEEEITILEKMIEVK